MRAAKVAAFASFASPSLQRFIRNAYLCRHRSRSRVASVGPLSLVLIFGIALTADSAFAQQATALLTGTVKDASGAVVVGAKVTLKNANTNAARTQNTGKDGSYLFNAIPIGTYEVSVEQTGF